MKVIYPEKGVRNQLKDFKNSIFYGFWILDWSQIHLYRRQTQTHTKKSMPVKFVQRTSVIHNSSNDEEIFNKWRYRSFYWSEICSGPMYVQNAEPHWNMFDSECRPAECYFTTHIVERIKWICFFYLGKDKQVYFLSPVYFHKENILMLVS